jgi:predicted HTH transcriptional regulator
MIRTIPENESLTVEFKSDLHRLRDAELAQAAVCLANTDGGEIYLGIEDDGRVTGLHQAHRNLTGLAAMIAGFDAIQQEQMVSRYVKTHGQITRRETVELCNLTPDQAYRLLNRLTEQGVLARKGEGKATVYESGPNLSNRA